MPTERSSSPKKSSSTRKPSRPAAKPAGKSGAKPGGKPTSKPGAKAGGKSGAKPGAKPASSSGGRKPASAGAGSGKPGGARSGKPTSSRSGKPSEARTGKPAGKPGSTTGGPSSARPSSARPSTPRSASASGPGGAAKSGSRPGAKPGAKPDRRAPGSGGGDRRLPKGRTSAAKTRPEQAPRDPHIADDVSVAELDKGILNELRTLPEGLALIVGRHLAAADRALVDGDVPTARAHIAAAKRRAGRVAAVREAAGITAYLDGDYAEAAAELRTVRRMTGSAAYLPMIADCERGMGRPQRALEIIKEADTRKLDPDVRVELTLVAAGARADMGQLEAALLVLQIPELTTLPRGGSRARLQYAYADLLARVGRNDEALEWMHRAADSDVDGVTDAAERVDEADGVLFIEEIDD